MAGGTFKTNPISLEELLRECEKGTIQLPDFQRSWVWDDDRIRSLIASIAQAFPVGALMTLETGGNVNFKPRAIQGAPDEASKQKPRYLLLDGQQRITSLYLAAIRRTVVETVTARRKRVRRWYYIDMRRALDAVADREEAIIGVPEDRSISTNFGKDIVLDLTSSEREYELMIFPINRVFDWDEWQDGFSDYWSDKDPEAKFVFREFKNEVLQSFKSYQVPVIELTRETSRAAVCLVFEKVNTGGKPLDAFELVTAMYAIDGFELRKDWYGEGSEVGRRGRLAAHKILENVASTDLLQAISLLHTKELRLAAARAGKQGRELPAISATRPSLLNLPLVAYQKYADRVEEGFKKAAKFLHSLRVYRVFDLPYQTQLVPLAAILAEIGDKWEHEGYRRKIVQWYWNGVFGELYGSTVESRFAKDIAEVPQWLEGGSLPSTISDATFRADRLKTMRMRLSAAYKGVNALLMKEGARDFRSGQEFDHTVFFNENVDIHHVFPRHWCKTQKISASVYDSIINKTPLTARTNRILGGSAPTIYLERLETGSTDAPPIEQVHLDGYLRSHLIEPDLLRADDFDRFMAKRQEALLGLIEVAMGQAVYRGNVTDEPEEEAADDENAESADELLDAAE